MQGLCGQSAGKTSVGINQDNVHIMKHRAIAFERAIKELRRLKGTERNYFIAGFVDGEGSFNIAFARQPSRPGGFLLNPKFQVYQHKDYEEILWVIREVLGAGRIDKKAGTDVRVLTIENRTTLTEKVIPFFYRYPVVTKRYALDVFREIMERMKNGDHLSLKGFLGIIDLAYDMNQHGKARKILKEQLCKEVEDNFHQLKYPQRPDAER